MSSQIELKQQNPLTKEDIIIRTFFEDPLVQGKVASKLDRSLFKEESNVKIIDGINEYLKSYKKFPQASDLYLVLPDDSKEKMKLFTIMTGEFKISNKKFLYDSVQQFFRDRMTYNILLDAGQAVFEQKIDEIAPLVKKLQEAVNYSLQTNIGLDALEDTQTVLDRLLHVNVPIPSASAFIRGITGTQSRSGGWMRKALSMYMGMTNIGKTIHLCNDAAYAYRCGYNVLYVTLELAEEFILQRIYSNVTDMDYKSIPGQTAQDIVRLMKSNVEDGANHGQLFVREMGSNTTALDLENLINEIKLTHKLDIDFLVVDYIGKMKPLKRKNVGNFSHTTYTMGTDVAEQLRDLAVSMNMALLTASQVTRAAYDTTDVSMKNTADSAGINNTADLIVIITNDQNLKKMGLFLNHIIKNRFGPKDISYLSHCDYNHMRIKDASQEQQSRFIAYQTEKESPVSGFNRPNSPSGKDNKKQGPTPQPEFSITFEGLGKTDAIIKTKLESPVNDIQPPNKRDLVISELPFIEQIKPINDEPSDNLEVTETKNTKDDVDLTSQSQDSPIILPKNEVISYLDNNHSGVILPEDKGIFINGFSKRLF